MKAIKWSKFEKQFLRNNYTTLSTNRIMAKLNNRTLRAIRIKACYLRLTKKQGEWNKKQINEQFFDKWSDEMAYVLGFFAADGNMRRDIKKQRHIISFAQSNKKILKKIAKLMNWDASIHVHRTNSDEVSYSISMVNKYIYNKLLKLGFTPTKSLTLKFPNIPTKYLRHFMRGNFDGDGSAVLNSGRYLSGRFISGSLVFLKTLKNKLLMHNIECSKIFNNPKYYFCVNKNGVVNLYNFLYNNVSKEMFLERKHNKFIRYFEVRKIDYKKEFNNGE